jgi:hypothetical protein
MYVVLQSDSCATEKKCLVAVPGVFFGVQLQSNIVVISLGFRAVVVFVYKQVSAIRGGDFFVS